MKPTQKFLSYWSAARLILVFMLAALFNTSTEGQVINASISCWSSEKPFNSLEYHDSMMYATTKSPAYYRFDMNYNMVIDSIAVGTHYPIIRGFHSGRDGHLYAQTDTFVMRKTPTGWISTGFSPPMYALISVDNQSNIWAWKTLPQNPPVHQIFRFDGTTAVQYLNPLPFSYVNNKNFIADDSGAVWVGTWDGLFRFTPTGYTHYFPGDVIGDMHIDDQNRLYFACDTLLMIRDTNGFSIFNPNVSMNPYFPAALYTTKVFNNTYYIFRNGWGLPHDLQAVTAANIQSVNLSGMYFCQDSVIADLHFDPYGRYWFLGLASGDNGHIYVQDSTLLSYITGKVFQDINWSGVYDTGDLPLQNVAVNNILTGAFAYSDSQGDYQISIPGMIGISYWVNQMLQSPWVLTSSPAYYSGVLFPNTPATNIDFGYSSNVPPTFLDISAFGAIFSLPPGFSSNAYFYAQNLSAFTVYNVEAWYVHDALFSSYSCNIPPTTSGPDTAYWLIDSLLPLESRVFHITLPLPPLVTIGTPFDLTFYINHPIDSNATNDTVRLSNLVNNSYDPNDKLVHPDRPEKDIAPDELLTYTIRFQNIGTAPAINVVLRDTLSPHLDLSKLQFVGSSHPYTWVINPGNELEITFANIYLPDSATIPEESVGAISFTIKPLPGLANGTEITNEAAIYFDFNLPIITGKTHSYIKDLSIGIHQHGRYHATIWPNPADDFLWIEHPGFRSGELIRVTLYDLQGRMVAETNQTPEQQRISIDTRVLKPGYYFGTCVMADNSAVSFRMVKKP